MTEEQRRQARLDTYARYNASAKGQGRHKAYEARHPERRSRWKVLETYQKDRSA